MSHWLRLFQLTRGLRLVVLLSLVLLLAAKLIEVAIPVYLGRFMDQVLQGSLPLQMALYLALWTLFAYLLESGNTLLMRYVGERAILRLRTRLFARVQSLDVAFFDGERVGQLMSRTISDTEQINYGISQSLIAILGSLLLVVGIFLGMFFVDWRVALLITASMPLLFGLTHRFRLRQRESYAKVRAALGRLNTFVQEHLLGLRVIRNFGLERQERVKFEEHNRDFREANVETIRHFASFFAGLEWIKNLLLTLAFVGLVLFATPGAQFDAGTFFSFSLYLLLFFRPLRFLAEQYNTFQDALASAARVFSLMDRRPTILSGAEPIESVQSLRFDGVSFAYGEAPVLRDVSFEVGRGETVALVGPTGSGKSTIMSLLLRFYEANSGAIRVNGLQIQDYSLEALRRQFNMVLQDPAIFSGTVLENVALYNREISPSDVERALVQVGAWDFVSRLPQGLETELQERGKQLSAGEKQLISLARAVAHPGSVLIFDEATANIDTHTEHLIHQALAQLREQVTTLVIAHRLSTIRDADRILVLHEGQIRESGSHAELLAQRGLYEKLHRWQQPT